MMAAPQRVCQLRQEVETLLQTHHINYDMRQDLPKYQHRFIFRLHTGYWFSITPKCVSDKVSYISFEENNKEEVMNWIIQQLKAQFILNEGELA